MGGAIDGFYSTWKSTRESFGEGTPATGQHLTSSSTALRGLDPHLAAAAPGSRWNGTAATAYDAANTEHRKVIGQLADLDTRLAREIDNSAKVVTAGRQNLDAVKQWVAAAEASVPPGKAGDQMKMVIAQRGLAQIQEIIQKTNAESNAIGGRIQELGGKYQELGIQKFGPKEGQDPLNITGKGEEDEKETRDWAKDTVGKSLTGDPAAAAEVDRVLNSMSAEQRAGTAPMSAEQQQVLSQMQYQTHDKSLTELTDIRDNLGDKKDILANSWQVMSDPDVKVPVYNPMVDAFPGTSGLPTQPGSKEMLPTSIQDVLNEPATSTNPNDDPKVQLRNQEDLRTVAGLIRDGDPTFQHGSYLDAGLMERGAEILDSGATQQNSTAPMANHTVEDIFTSAGRDHDIAHEMITGKGDMVNADNKGEKFLNQISYNNWGDDGAAARTLTDWVDDAAANNADPVMDRKAGETAFAIADYLGDNHDNLKNMYLYPSTLGELNPALVQGFGEALAPYQEAMIGDRTDPAPGFDALDGQDNGNYDHARKVFAIIDTDPTAAKAFNQHAYESILQYQQETRDVIGGHGPMDGSAMGNAGRMLGVVNGAADMSQFDPGYDFRKEALSGAIGVLTPDLPIVKDMGVDYLTNAILGDGTFDKPVTHDFTEVERMERWTVASALSDGGAPLVGVDTKYTVDGRLMTPEEAAAQRPGQLEDYYQELRDYSARNGWADPLGSFRDEYDRGLGTR